MKTNEFIVINKTDNAFIVRAQELSGKIAFNPKDAFCFEKLPVLLDWLNRYCASDIEPNDEE